MENRPRGDHTQASHADREQTAASNQARPLCWNCAERPVTYLDDRLCDTCTNGGADPYWLPCTRPEHTHVKRRTVRGQQRFTCTGPADPDPY